MSTVKILTLRCRKCKTIFDRKVVGSFTGSPSEAERRIISKQDDGCPVCDSHDIERLEYGDYDSIRKENRVYHKRIADLNKRIKRLYLVFAFLVSLVGILVYLLYFKY